MAKTIKEYTSEKPPLDKKKRVTIYIRESAVKEMKYIAFMDDTSQTDIIDEALKEYVKKWVAKRGPIPKK